MTAGKPAPHLNVYLRPSKQVRSLFLSLSLSPREQRKPSLTYSCMGGVGNTHMLSNTHTSKHANPPPASQLCLFPGQLVICWKLYLYTEGGTGWISGWLRAALFEDVRAFFNPPAHSSIKSGAQTGSRDCLGSDEFSIWFVYSVVAAGSCTLREQHCMCMSVHGNMMTVVFSSLLFLFYISEHICLHFHMKYSYIHSCFFIRQHTLLSLIQHELFSFSFF